MKKIMCGVVLLLVLLLVVSGCGGGGDVQPEAEPVEESSEPLEEEQAAEAEEEEEYEDCVPAGDEEAGEMIMPADLTTFHDFNKFATDLMIEKVKPGIFNSPVFSDDEKEEARKALVLIIAAYDEAIKLNDQNEHVFYNRGRAYAQVYFDTDDPSYKDKALADFEKALGLGLDMAQKEIDNLQN